MNSCLTNCSLGRKILMSLGQDGPIYAYTHPQAKHIERKACYGRRAVANTLEFESSANTSFFNNIRPHLNYNTDDIFHSMQEYNFHEDVYKERYGKNTMKIK